MINVVQETYLKLLRKALWGGNGEWLRVCGECLPDVIHLAALQGTGPLIYDQLLKLKDLEITADSRMQMKQQCVHSIMMQQAMFSTLAQAWKELEAADLHPVLLKGFAISQYYPQPHLRHWGDIDIYVGQKQYHAACKVLQTTFPNAEHPLVEDEERKHYNFILPNTVLELHRISMEFAHPLDRRYYERLEYKYFTKDGCLFDLEGLSITTPDDTFNLFFVFLHAWHHFIGTGMNMKQLCDIAILLHAKRDVIKRERLYEMLVKLHMMEPWQLIMHVVAQYLGVSQEECPFYTETSSKRAERLYIRVLSEGSSRPEITENAEGASYIRRKLLTFQSRLSSAKLVQPYAPKYARHMVWSSIVHGIERTFNGK